jgi:hypothetical protein
MLPTRCTMACCSRVFWTEVKDETGKAYQALLPLKRVGLIGMLNGAIAHIDMQMEYVNAS